MTEKGGGFAYLISSMEKYGLIQTGGGDVTVTELGKVLMAGEPKEIEQARSKAVTNVELFRDIAQKYGKNPQVEQIKMFLREKANLDVIKAQKIAQSVDKIYKKVSNYITTAERLTPSSGIKTYGLSSGRRETGIMDTEIGKEPLKIQKGGLYIEIPSDSQMLENLEYAKDFLIFMEGKLKGKSESKKDK